MAVAFFVGAGIGLGARLFEGDAGLETVSVERGPVRASVTVNGRLNAAGDVLVGSQVSGILKDLYADRNSKVKKGQLIALIDPVAFQAQLDQATARNRAAHSATVTAAAQVKKANTELLSALANQKDVDSIVSKDAANEDNARDQWEQAHELVQAGVITAQDYDSARAAYDAAQAQLRADEAKMGEANQSVQSTQAQVQSAQDRLASALAQERQTQAALQQAQVNLDRTRILAPVDGTVIARHMDVGQTVDSTRNPPTIFEIAQDLTRMQVDTSVGESDIGNIRVGQEAIFTVDAYAGTTFQGKVTDVYKAAVSKQNVVTYDVVIGVSNPDLKLSPGMPANVRILTGRVHDTLRVPNAVLRLRPSVQVLRRFGVPAPEAGTSQVYVLTAGKLKAVPVKFGVSDGRFTVVSGKDLKAGDRVVSRF